jgi:hypothetical protein
VVQAHPARQVICSILVAVAALVPLGRLQQTLHRALAASAGNIRSRGLRFITLAAEVALKRMAPQREQAGPGAVELAMGTRLPDRGLRIQAAVVVEKAQIKMRLALAALVWQ